MPSNYNNILRLISLSLVVAFLSQDISYAAPLESMNVGAHGRMPLQQIIQNPSALEIPLQFSNLKEIYNANTAGAGSPRPYIIHIQDAHSNYSGQLNLSKTLDTLIKKYQIKDILVEGGSKDNSLNEIRKLAPKEVWDKVAKKFLLEGKLQGEEYLNLTSKHNMKILGIEDMTLYMDSLKSYSLLATQREKTLNYLKKIQTSLEKLKNKTYPKELLEYEKTKDSFEGSFKELIELSKDIKNYPNISKLKDLQAKEKTIDFNLANLEQASLLEELSKTGSKEDLDEFFSALRGNTKDSKLSSFAFFQKLLTISKEKNLNLTKYPNLINYGDYLRSFTDIDLEELLNEKERLEDEVYKRYLSDAEGRVVSVLPRAVPQSDAKHDGRGLFEHGKTDTTLPHDALLIRSIDRYLNLLLTAYKIQMTTKDFETFKLNEPDFLTISYLSFINRKLTEAGYFEDLIPYENTLEEGKDSLKSFYDSVSKRDEAFIKNTKTILGEQTPPTPLEIKRGEASTSPSLSKRGQGSSPKVVVLISGGYHTQNLTRLFKEEGYSYAVLTPIVTSETNQAR